jgi:hypothetical protein
LEPSCFTVNAWPATVIVPLRELFAVLAATVYPIEPLPLPFDFDGVSHVALLLAVQAQLPAALSVNDPVPPARPMLALLGDSVPVHAAGSGWLTVTACPPIVTVSVRALLVVFDVAVSVTLPLPLPLAGDTVIHVDDVVASQVQPAGEVTLTVALPPLAGAVTVVGDTVKLQVAPGWLTVTDWPATVTVAVRALDDGLAWAVMVTEAVPLELDGDTVSHATPELAVHEHPP